MTAYLRSTRESARSRISLYFSCIMPGTFSARKNFGSTSDTMRKKSTNSALRASCRLPFPMKLNPWHGGLPMTPSTFSRPSRRFSDCPVRPAMSSFMWVVPGKFRLWALRALGSTSTAPRTANPARAEPRLSPPTPQKRSTTFAVLERLSPGPQGRHQVGSSAWFITFLVLKRRFAINVVALSTI